MTNCLRGGNSLESGHGYFVSLTTFLDYSLYLIGRFFKKIFHQNYMFVMYRKIAHNPLRLNIQILPRNTLYRKKPAFQLLYYNGYI